MGECLLEVVHEVAKVILVMYFGDFFYLILLLVVGPVVFLKGVFCGGVLHNSNYIYNDEIIIIDC